MYASVSEERVHTTIEKSMGNARKSVCSNVTIDPVDVIIEQELNVQNIRKRKISESYVTENEWSTTNYFE